MGQLSSLSLEPKFMGHVLVASFNPFDCKMTHLVHHAWGLHLIFSLLHAMELVKSLGNNTQVIW